MDIYFWLTYLGVGVFVGFFAGLLGIGGGAVMVPILSLTFASRGFSSDHVVHMALATSMATIIPGAFASAWTHHQHQAVNWDVLRKMVPGILVGTFSGAITAHFASTAFLKSFFVGFICFLAVQLLFDIRPKSRHALPGSTGLFAFGVLMGVISSFAGIGGAVLSIAFLTWCNMRMHEAIGTAAAIGVPLAIAGTVGFVATGMMDRELPPWSLGYVYLPAFAGIAITSFVVAPLGAKLAHRMPVVVLRRGFVVFLVALAAKMAVSV
jgi:uncharacterized membrane protein YfcA